ncbi:MAG: DUF4295 domain-containing protein [Flavobacteriales bacterium]|jgi:hypothetical protein|nr:DUF4295 domain-containing protein [Flavobacteriales bacterium]MBK6752098.1 DUF4295 domain-containing protein [Flavobacteriales bacterium]MBK7086739.1 DUF4295 domain-containing protein [Flavobacteriales bacterium]MBK7269000.1 DUF4295 domain-containing protein [Flavobacteriales bacterium]MBK7752445.1 DUF4295 domain-containing protein [Flavobacteriales bacterium]
MAKKVVASLKKADAKVFTKVIRMVRNGKTGGYQFQEMVMPAEEADKFLAQKK